MRPEVDRADDLPGGGGAVEGEFVEVEFGEEGSGGVGELERREGSSSRRRSDGNGREVFGWGQGA